MPGRLPARELPPVVQPLVFEVLFPVASPGVLRDEHLLCELIQLVQVDIREDGDTTPPCGQPLSVSWYSQSSRYPALSMLADQPQKPVIVDFLPQDPDHYLVVKVPKQSAMSPSMNHVVPVQVRSISRSAV